ncbi:MAG TPA: GGDEF domain-containing protein, partial [Chloroflexota bacterium]|nr:GGDEF domain-containing protein [Chloroflexota bacterium]
EEFCVLLPEIPPGEAEGVAERLREAIAAEHLPVGAEMITVSVGVAHRRAGDAGTDLFTRADQAMYQAKYAGGNAVAVADEDGFRAPICAA